MLIKGDSLQELKTLDDNSVDSVVSDPPYGLSFMGKHWDYDVPSVELWQECLRVLKPGGHALIACGTRTQHRMAVNLEDAGFEIRDIVAWVYGSGFPKSLNIGKAVDKIQGNEREVVAEGRCGKNAMYGGLSGNDDLSGKYSNTKGTSPYEGYGTALKPSSEYWTLVRKPLESSSDLCYNLGITKDKICQSISHVLTAENNSKSNQQGQKEVASIAQWIAESNISTLEDLFVLMDMLQSYATVNTNWNIVLSWLNILAGIWQLTNISTTKTKISPITELKILSSLEWESILANITHVSNNQTNGLNASAFDAVSLFNALRLALLNTHTLIAQENASSVQLDPRVNLELWTLCRKPIKGTIAQNCLEWGTGGLNIDGCRVGTEEIKTNGKGKQDGNTPIVPLSPDFIGETHQGRFPANLITDGSDEVVGLFPNDTQRFFYTAKASKSERNKGLGGFEEQERVRQGLAGEHNNTFSQNHHPTVKPVSLMRYLCKLITPKGGTILDPFMGSGTTGIGAKLEGFDFIGIEREEDYLKIAQARIDAWEPDKQQELL